MNSNQKTIRAYVPRQSLDLKDEQLMAGYAKSFKICGMVIAVIFALGGFVFFIVAAANHGADIGILAFIASLVIAFLNYLFFLFFYAILKVFSNISTTLKDSFILMSGKTDENYVKVEVSNMDTVSLEAANTPIDMNNESDLSIEESLPLVKPEGAEEFEANGVKFTMAKVEGGTYEMGGTSEQTNVEKDELPIHSVTLSDYMIGQTLVSQELWKAVMGANPSKFQGAKFPVESVSWEDCQIFITKLNELTGKQFRMPTEAEWEYAARGGKMSKGYQYAGSDTLNEVAWFADNSEGRTHAVGTKSPNELGVYDMSGNVWEWCHDWFDKKYYRNTMPTNPQGPSKGSGRVNRGRSWNGDVRNCRVSYRLSNAPDSRFYNLGLRLAL